jgi:hypothetical protein
MDFLMEPWVTYAGIGLLIVLGVWWMKFRPQSY